MPPKKDKPKKRLSGPELAENYISRPFVPNRKGSIKSRRTVDRRIPMMSSDESEGEYDRFMYRGIRDDENPLKLRVKSYAKSMKPSGHVSGTKGNSPFFAGSWGIKPATFFATSKRMDPTIDYRTGNLQVGDGKIVKVDLRKLREIMRDNLGYKEYDLTDPATLRENPGFKNSYNVQMARKNQENLILLPKNLKGNVPSEAISGIYAVKNISDIDYLLGRVNGNFSKKETENFTRKKFMFHVGNKSSEVRQGSKKGQPDYYEYQYTPYNETYIPYDPNIPNVGFPTILERRNKFVKKYQDPIQGPEPESTSHTLSGSSGEWTVEPFNTPVEIEEPSSKRIKHKPLDWEPPAGWDTGSSGSSDTFITYKNRNGKSIRVMKDLSATGPRMMSSLAPSSSSSSSSSASIQPPSRFGSYPSQKEAEEDIKFLMNKNSARKANQYRKGGQVSSRNALSRKTNTRQTKYNDPWKKFQGLM